MTEEIIDLEMRIVNLIRTIKYEQDTNMKSDNNIKLKEYSSKYHRLVGRYFCIDKTNDIDTKVYKN